MSEQSAIVKMDDSTLENVLISGDLSKLTSPQRVQYYKKVCESLGLNPFTKPFEYITLNNKLTLYAKKDATDQLRSIQGVSIDDVEIQETATQFIVKVKGHNRDNRQDVEVGVVNKSDMNGNLANAQMKAVTKGKRRLTLSLCGLGWLDETEIETIPTAKPVTVIQETGEIVDAAPVKDAAPFTLADCEAMVSSDGIRYGDMMNADILNRLNAMVKAKNPDDARLLKIEMTKALLKARNSGEAKEPTPLVDAAAELGGVPA
jgi:hypothetical protein